MPTNDRARVHVQRETSTRTATMDMGLMRLALRNLLSNALKYAPPDTPVSVRLTDSDEPLALVIEVSDQGPGFDVSKLPDPNDPSVWEKPSGRGLILIRSFFDDMAHSPTGNEIRLSKRQPEAVVE